MLFNQEQLLHLPSPSTALIFTHREASFISSDKHSTPREARIEFSSSNCRACANKHMHPEDFSSIITSRFIFALHTFNNQYAQNSELLPFIDIIMIFSLKLILSS